MARGTKTVRNYKLVSLPYLVIIDSNGKIAENKVFMKFEAIKETVDALLEPSELKRD